MKGLGLDERERATFESGGGFNLFFLFSYSFFFSCSYLFST